MILLAIDPGTTESAWMTFDTVEMLPLVWAKWTNENLLSNRMEMQSDYCVIEMVGHYGTGMSVGSEVFDTCVNIGMFKQAWWAGRKEYPSTILRKTVAAHICGSARAKDSNIRTALIDRYGGVEKAIGGKKCPQCKGKGSIRVRGSVLGPVTCGCFGGLVTPKGPLHGIADDCWSALAIAVTYTELYLKAGKI